MKLTVFGASGGIGGHVVHQALDAGHQVSAVVRDPARLTLRRPGLELVTVRGLDDVRAVAAALAGSDAALSAVGPRKRKDGPVASSATRGILQGFAVSGARRFVAVSAAPVGAVPDGDSFLNRRILMPFIGLLLHDVYADLSLMEEEIRQSSTDWTVLRPPKLVNRPLTGRYRTAVGSNVPRGLFISRADAAHAMLAALANAATVGEPLGIAY
ncbi:epimerase [Arthrobacter livingstonensis]|uniref:Epimerase n=1 Tax=Arthrobacter livingstonensis TaxID=670078 RepID=A0A2V5L6P3_9MICC|nr:NAD(P)H-binding protein [Arthrobacter livingstonensis]PYI67049.1 epimerase [Arthrobacter livingstonensis]